MQRKLKLKIASIAMLFGFGLSMQSAMAVTYQYSGKGFRGGPPAPYTSNMGVTATITLSSPLPANLSPSNPSCVVDADNNLCKIGALPGFALSMNDGVQTLTGAFISSVYTDGSGNIVKWGVSSVSGAASIATQNWAIPPIDGATNGSVSAQVKNNPGRWVLILPPPPSSTACNGVYGGTFKGNISVSSGQSCVFIGGEVTGNISAGAGGYLGLSNGAQVDGSVSITGSTAFSLNNATVKGNVLISGVKGTSQLCGSNIVGNFSLQNNSGAVLVGGPTGSGCNGNNFGDDITHPNVSITKNTGQVSVFYNKGANVFSCSGNNLSITGTGNQAALLAGQCAGFN